ncbi:MAG TPA: penicillin-binding protein 2 [Candidatus Omnitrophota bacterium]|nr:penicillin-binding protein 2 [Candidatus Omnitrophota bacterium]
MYIRRNSLRFISVVLSIIFALAFFSFRLVFIQIFRSQHLEKLAKRQHNHSIEIEPIRGTIYDRKGRPLALNIAAYSLYANPRQMSEDDKKKAIAELPRVLGLPPAFLKERLSRDKFFVWIQRKMPLSVSEEIRALKINGLGFIRESKRHYPNNYLAAHVIGFAGIDGHGLEGLELQFDEYLRGESGWMKIVRDARQRDLMMDLGFIPPKDGFHIVLTLDETIQFIAEEALDKAFAQHKALSATIIVMNPKTGEILALANRPTYELSNPGGSDEASRTNRAIAHVYEPGSVFKIVAATAALEENVFKEEDVIFCENGTYKVGNHILHDHGSHGKLSFRQVIEQSSNIGTTKVAQKMGAEVFYKYAQRFRFGQLTGIDLKGEVGGVLKHPSRWSATTIGALPIGHEVTVTPLQLVCAMSAVANGGVYMKPFVVKYITDHKEMVIREFQPEAIDRVMTPETCERLKKILQGAVESGTGKRARIKGVSVAGKTGTSQKVVGGQYSHDKYFASFIGFAPVEDPKIAVVVMFDEPHPSYFGGTVAAPVFQEVAVDALKYIEAIEQGL